jgi:predicted NUDIX family NTP pyrophosphohydrolase
VPNISAGLLLYRWSVTTDGSERRLQVLLVHPGGPYWMKKDLGAWSIPKGEAEPQELTSATLPGSVDADRADLLAVARREVHEETGLKPGGPFLPLGGVKAHHHKLVYAWAVEHDCEPADLVSNAFTIEWPPRSGKRAAFPEVDRAQWFDLPAAREAIVPAQRRFIDDLAVVAGDPGSAFPSRQH